MDIERSKIDLLCDEERVIMMDQDEETGLELFCYDSPDPDLYNYRGIVFNGYNLVMKAFPYTLEYNHKQLDEYMEILKPDFKNWKFFEAHEGTLLRMFCFSGKWYLSTHHKLDAFRSKWGSNKSFGEMFVEALEVIEENDDNFPDGDEPIYERFQNSLDTSKQYMFLVCNDSKNRVVCKTEKPTVFHVGTFDADNVGVMVDTSCCVPKPAEHTFDSVKDIQNFVKKIDCFKIAGLICLNGDQQIKVVNSKYQRYFEMRGNQPSVPFRYLEIRMEDPEIVEAYCNLYPDYSEVFDLYEDALYDASMNIFKYYINRYVKKNDPENIPQEDYTVARECHVWHNENRRRNLVTPGVIMDCLNHQPAPYLNKIVKRYKEKKARENEEN